MGVLGVVLVASCSSTASAPNLIDGDRVSPAGAKALLDGFARLSPAEQRRAVAQSDSHVERALWTVSGVEAAPGGKAPADTAFAGLNTAVSTLTATTTEQVNKPPSFGKTAAPGGYAAPRADDYTAEGASLFASMLVVSVSADTAAGQIDGIHTGSASEGGVTRSANPTTGTVETHLTTTYGGVDVGIDTKAVMTPCPDANGVAKGSISAAATTSKAGKGYRYELSVESTIQVNDDANIASTATDSRWQQSDFQPGGRHFVDVSVAANNAITLNRSVGTVTAEMVTQSANAALTMGSLLESAIEHAAQDHWSSGRCVTLKPTVSQGPKALPPKATVTVIAAPRATGDGSPTGGTVTATLTAGSASVSPSRTKVKADATFTYSGPPEKEQTGDVDFEARSKRGVARASIHFDTYKASFAAEGGGGEWQASGQICSLVEPFTLTGNGLTAHFTPASETGGSYTLSGSAGGVSWSGTGTYQVALGDARTSGTLTMSGTNTIASPVGTVSDSATATFALRSTANC